jgi:hypothetical protein
VTVLHSQSRHRLNQFILNDKFGITILIVGLVCVGVFYATVWSEAPVTASDTQGYLEVALDLQDGTLDDLQYRTPGYPLLLLVTGSTMRITPLLFYVQLSLHLLIVLGLALALHKMRIRKGLIGVFLLISILPPWIESTAYVLSEALTQALLVAGFLCLWIWIANNRWLLLAMASLCFALSGLVRPTYQLISFAVVVAIVLLNVFGPFRFKRRIGAAILVLLLPAILLIGGLSAYNYYHFDYTGVTPLFGFNLSTRTVGVVEQLPDDYSMVREVLIKHRDQDLIERHSSHTGYMYIWSAIPELKTVTGLDKADLSTYMLRINLQLIAGAPLDYLQEVSRALVTYWFPSATNLANFDSRLIQLVWVVLHFALIGLFGVHFTGLTGLYTISYAYRPFYQIIQEIDPDHLRFIAVSLACLLILYTMAISTAVEIGNPRYRTPTDLLIVFFVVVGADTLNRFRTLLKVNR